MKPWRFLSLASIFFLLSALIPAQIASAAAACSITYTNQNDWGNGATIAVTITNMGTTAINGWTLTWAFSGNQVIANLWSGSYTQSGTAVSVKDAGFNGTIAANGGTATFGFNLNYTGTNAAPAGFALNGVTCGSAGGTTSTPSATSLPPATQTRTSTPGGPTVTPTRTSTRTNTPSGPTVTPTRTATKTNTPAGPSVTPTRTLTSTATGTPVTTGCGSLAICDNFENQVVGAAPAGSWQMIYPSCQGTGTATVDSTQAHSGTKSIRVDGGAGFCNHVFFGNTSNVAAIGPVVYGRLFIRISTALGTNHVTFMAMTDANDGGKNLRFGGQGQVMAWNRESDDATVPAMSPVGISLSAPLPVNQWSCLEFKVDGTNGFLQAWLNGNEVVGLAVDGVATTDIDAQWKTRTNWHPSLTDFKLGWESYSTDANTLWFDDVALGASRIGCGT